MALVVSRGLPGSIHRTDSFFRSLLSTPAGFVGAIIVGFAIFVAVFAPYLSPADPYRITRGVFSPPFTDTLLGRDNLGRDMASRLIWGTRTSLIFGFCAAGLSLAIGVIFGAISGYFGGIVDHLFSRLFEVFLMVPRLFLIILLVAVFGTNVVIAVAVVGFTLWPSNAKLMRSQVLTLKSRAFVRASLGSGASHWHVLVQHILPNGVSAIIANSSLQIAYAILLEASLSFLGLSDPNVVSWGQLIKQGQQYMVTGWWIITWPGLALVVLILGVYLLGDALAVKLNPQLRDRAAI